MDQAFAAMANDWVQVGGSLLNDFTLNGGNSVYGSYGILPNVLAPGSQRYDGLISTILPAGDANLDGTVDYADFQILAANYGATNTYWEQGDFNDDGMVNWQDLTLLRQNLNPAGFTDSQFAQQALFGQPSTVIPGQSLEYDGYGTTYASGLPLASTTGTVDLNTSSQGTPIVLGGATYSEGLGVLANSSTSLNLNGQYARFESTIGVDGSSDTGSSVIFDVYGDGTLLYQSPTLSYASGAVPIDVSVAGVNTLTLVVSPAPGSNSAIDNAVWADARLVSTANFGTQPDTLSWQLSQNGTVISTQTTDSFAFAAMSGTYTLTLTVTDAQGGTATASTSVVVTPAVTSAAFVARDSTTAGGWVGTYGSQGYDLVGDAVNLPNYATVTSAGATTATWTAAATAAPALTNPSDSESYASTWESPTSFTLDVNLTDGQAHTLTVYAADYGNQGLNEQIQVVNAATGAVLDTKTLQSFSGGDYLQWVVSGNVLIEVIKLSGADAVLSGLFFDAPTTTVAPAGSAVFVRPDTSTEGNWIGNYGTQGSDVVGATPSLPSYATVTTSGASTGTWASTTIDPRALQAPGGIGRVAGDWYSTTSFTVDVNLTDGQTHELELYLLDWNKAGIAETVTLSNGITGTVLNAETVSSFGSGEYLDWAVSGNVLITITRTAGADAVLSGIFLDKPAALASLTKQDATTQGNWLGTYGTEGYDIVGDAAAIPSYATVTMAGESTWGWTLNSNSTSAIEDAPGTGTSRVADSWYSYSSFTVHVNLTDGLTHDLELYFLDWDKDNRVENVTISNAVTGAVLGNETMSSFASGSYLDLAVSGNVLITIKTVSGTNAVLSGLFFDPSPVALTAPSVSASFVEQEPTTGGTWVGTYGTQGNDVIGSTASIPSYATVTPSGQLSYTWAATSTDPRALQTASGTSRIAACWYSYSSFSVDVNMAAGQSHLLELYFLDWDSSSRSESVTLTNPISGAVLSTETVSSFHSGVYLEWTVSGNVLITFTKLAGADAVLSGLFFDPPLTTTAATAAATYLSQDSTSEGTWIGTYGTQGYDLIGGTSSIPSYATLTPSGQSSYTWAATSTDPRALQTASGTSRIAACWYSYSSFSVDVNFTDGQLHNLELYFVDWDTTVRSESVTISDAVTGAMLSTQTVSSFHSGAYLEWAVSGNVLITFTKLSGVDAVLSGLFFDPATVSNAALAAPTGGTETGTTGGVGTGEIGTLNFTGPDIASRPVTTTDLTTITTGAVVPITGTAQKESATGLDVSWLVEGLSSHKQKLFAKNAP